MANLLSARSSFVQKYPEVGGKIEEYEAFITKLSCHGLTNHKARMALIMGGNTHNPLVGTNEINL